MGRSITGVAAGTIGDGAGMTALATMGSTGRGFGTSAFTTSRTGRGGAGAAGGVIRGATIWTGGNFTSWVVGRTNTILDRLLGAAGFSDARIGTRIRTTTTIACNPTLSHRPVVQRACGRVPNRASSNRIDMCRTEVKCRSVLLLRRCSLRSLLQQAKCRRYWETSLPANSSSAEQNFPPARYSPVNFLTSAYWIPLVQRMPSD